MKRITILKIAVHISAIIGVIIMIGNIRGWFIESERIGIYKKLTNEPYTVELNYPGVDRFLDNFYDPSRANQDIKSMKIKGLRSTWVSVGGNSPMAGNVHLWLEDDKQSTSLCTFDDLKDWSLQAPAYQVLALLLLIIGVFGNILIDIYARKRKKRQSAS